MPSQTRQLAAIMFSDIVGYTSLMGTDEKKAFDLLHKNRLIQKPLIRQFRGKFLKEMGDGILASFETVSDAVFCAGAIQKEVEQEEALNLKIGIHVGEVIFEENDVFGDGVNIASRIVAITPSGEIWGSGSVKQNVQNKAGIDTNFVKEENLKNVKDPVKLYRITVNQNIVTSFKPEQDASISQSRKSIVYVLIGLLLILISYFIVNWFLKNESRDVEIIDKSIAVLPFKNMSDDPQQAYFASGVTEEILTRLAKIRDLRVISRTSSMIYKDTEKTIPEIAEELNVTFILEGSVQKYENKIRITAQLIHAGNDNHLWAESYDRDFADVFAIQSEVSQSIARELKATVSPEVAKDLNARPTDNMEAYKLYLRGVQVIPDRTEAKLRQAMDLFNQAIQLDSTFAEAWAELANVTYLMFGWDYVNNTAYLDQAVELSNKAISLKKNMARPYSVLGAIYSNGYADHAKGLEYYLQALTFDPNDGTTFQRICDLLNETKFPMIAVTAGQKAVQIDPFSMVNNYKMIHAMISAKQFDTAWEKIQTFKKLFPDANDQAQHLSAEFYYYTGQCQDLSRLGYRWWQYFVPLCYSYINKEDSARKYLDLIKDIEPITHKLIQARIGRDVDRMFQIINEQYDQPAENQWFWSIPDPFFDILRSDSRYETTLARNPWNSITEEQVARLKEFTGI